MKTDELRKLRAEATQGELLIHDGMIKTVALLDPDQPKRGREVVATVPHSPNAALLVAAVSHLDALLDVADIAKREHHDTCGCKDLCDAGIALTHLEQTK